MYCAIGSLHCPYFGEKIYFTSEGFNHIRYRGCRKERHFKVQNTRYELLSFVAEIVVKSGTLQEYDVINEIKYFGFIAITRGWELKVIIRQKQNGKKHFWSVIPNWKTRNKEYKNHTGDLQKD